MTEEQMELTVLAVEAAVRTCSAASQEAKTLKALATTIRKEWQHQQKPLLLIALQHRETKDCALYLVRKANSQAARRQVLTLFQSTWQIKQDQLDQWVTTTVPLTLPHNAQPLYQDSLTNESR